MLNSTAAGRQWATHAARYQAVVVLALGGLCLAWGWQHALAAWLGGGVVVLAGVLAARIALAQGVAGSEVAVLRFILSVVARWAVVIAGLALGAGPLRLPLLPMLAGVVAALAASMWALARVRR